MAISFRSFSVPRKTAAAMNSVTLVERDAIPGGALRLAALAPRFQNVDAEPRAFEAYVSELEQACRDKGVEFRYGVRIERLAELDGEFDRIVIATGARYRLGATQPIASLLRSGWGRSGLGRWLFSSERVKNWFYHRARTPALVPGITELVGRDVLVIGDALAPGRTREAIESAFKAAQVQ
jgi:dimethylglycine catabolism A